MGETKPWVMPALAGASQVAGGLFGWIGNRKQRQHEQKMYQKEFQDSLMMWGLQNQYDSPAMQMKRLKEAGLNPHLMYGEGPTASQGTADLQQPKMDVSQARQVVQPVNPGSFMQSMYDMQYKNAQIDLAKAQIVTQGSVARLNTINSDLAQVKMERERQTTDFEKKSFDTRIQTLEAERDLILADIQKVGQDTRTGAAMETNIREQTRKLQQDIIFAAQKQPEELKKLLAEIANLYSSTTKNKAELGLISQQISESEVREFNGALEAALTQTGYNKNDSAFQRILKGLLHSAYALGNMKQAKEKLQELRAWIAKHRK